MTPKKLRDVVTAIIAAIQNRSNYSALSGHIGRYDHHANYVRLRLDTERGERINVRVCPHYWQTLNLERGDWITVDRYEPRSDSGAQYIQALSIDDSND